MKPIDIKKVKESKKVLTVMENTKRVIQQSDDDEWKAELNRDQIKKIENAFFEEMKELKYL